MKKTYIKPKTGTVVIIGPRLMLTGSNNVNEFSKGDDIFMGDKDED